MDTPIVIDSKLHSAKRQVHGPDSVFVDPQCIGARLQGRNCTEGQKHERARTLGAFLFTRCDVAKSIRYRQMVYLGRPGYQSPSNSPR